MYLDNRKGLSLRGPFEAGEGLQPQGVVVTRAIRLEAKDLLCLTQTLYQDVDLFF